MKTLKLLFVVLLSILIYSACQKTPDDSLAAKNKLQENNEILNARAPGQIAIPFKADFYTIKSDSVNAEICDQDPFLSFNYQVGEGNATHLGKCTVTLFFCGDNSTFTYMNGEGSFVAANGDELYFFIPSPDSIGQVTPYDHPLYEFQFQDPFTFNGGTGRFEGASGGGYTNSFVNLFEDGVYLPNHQTDHEWTGTLILPKKNK